MAIRESKREYCKITCNGGSKHGERTWGYSRCTRIVNFIHAPLVPRSTRYLA
jgi:hypothetical protein